MPEPKGVLNPKPRHMGLPAGPLNVAGPLGPLSLRSALPPHAFLPQQTPTHPPKPDSGATSTQPSPFLTPPPTRRSASGDPVQRLTCLSCQPYFSICLKYFQVVMMQSINKLYFFHQIDARESPECQTASMEANVSKVKSRVPGSLPVFMSTTKFLH